MEMDKQEQEFDTEKFIASVKQRPVLWNTKLSSNKDKRMKKNAWDEIGEIFNFLGKDAEIKWKSLRDSFNIYSKKNVPSGSAATNSKSWPFYDQMSFVAEFIRPRNQSCKSNMPPISSQTQKRIEPTEADDDDDDYYIRFEDKHKTGSEKVNSLNNSEQYPVDADQTETALRSTSTSSQPSTSKFGQKRRKSSAGSIASSEATCFYKELAQTASKLLEERNDEDEIKTFASLVEKKLHKVDASLLDDCQSDILKIIRQHTIKTFDL